MGRKNGEEKLNGVPPVPSENAHEKGPSVYEAFGNTKVSEGMCRNCEDSGNFQKA